MKRYLLVAILSIAALPIFGQNYPTYSENYSDKRYLFTSEEIADADVAYTNTVLEYRKTLGTIIGRCMYSAAPYLYGMNCSPVVI